MTAAALSLDEIRRAPKALLHDHLDGGHRPATIVELAAEGGYRGLPTTDPDDLGRWMARAAARHSLELYIETFVHTIGITQSPDAIARVAAECAEDLAADGIVYAEVRFAPELHTQRGLSMDQVVRSVLEGFAEGSRGRNIRIVGLLCAMRSAAHSLEVAELAVRHRDEGIVGFDIAGAEAGYPPTRHLAAFQYLQRANFHFTIHAGEGFGLPSIWEAVQYCGAERLGHGVRIAEDIVTDADDPDAPPRLGHLAAFVRDRRIPLELCPSSNVHTGLTPSIVEHPIDLLRRLRFRVTINTDNRLMSDTSLSTEMHLCAEAFGWDMDDLRWLTINAVKSSFIPFDERLALIDDVIKPGYKALRDVQAPAPR